MDKICGLKFQLSYVDMLQDFFWKFLYVIIVTEFVPLIKISPSYEVNSLNRKWQTHGVISKVLFLDHFSPSFSENATKI